MSIPHFSLSRQIRKSLMILADGLMIPAALWMSFALVESRIISVSLENFFTYYLLSSVVSVITFYRMGLYRTIILYMGLQSALVVLKAVTIATLILSFIIYLLSNNVFLSSAFPASVLPVFWMISLLFVGGGRLMTQAFQQNIIQNFRPKEPVIIYGAGSSGMQLAAALNNGEQYLPVAFVDDSSALMGDTVYGIQVFSPVSMGKIIENFSVRQILLAIPSASHAERKEILNRVEQYPVHVRTVPELFDMVSGKVGVDEIRDIDIVDLLGRDTVPADPQLMGACIKGNSVLVTGAGGSIGAELCHQIIKLEPERIILYDNSEYGLYTIEGELMESLALMGKSKDIQIIALLGSVRNRMQVESAISKFNVKTVYHAAAYKQVPMVEKNIVEGVQNNIFGTLVVAQSAEKYNVEHFVLISTDKAVRPANVMGATKRFAEQILQALAAKENSKIKFSMVRFGNVLGSSGSVVPLFRKQISQGGPITVTHSEVTRYFMTVQEAAQLVIQAGSMASGGDVFVLDMLEPVRIIDLARKMIHLMGYMERDEKSPNGDIAIKYTGLRPGEKLYEELLIGESVTGTDHPKIMRAEEDFLSWDKLQDLLGRLEKACSTLDQNVIRGVLSEAIGGFVSKEDINDPMLDIQLLQEESGVGGVSRSKKVTKLFS